MPFCSLLLCFFLEQGQHIIKTVHTELSPKQSRTLVFKKIRTVDTENLDVAWARPGISLDMDSKGNVYVCNDELAVVHQFDAQGNFIRVIGGYGQGPGQFNWLYRFQLLQDDKAVAIAFYLSQASFHYYNSDMQFTGKMTLDTNLLLGGRIAVSPKGNLIYSVLRERDHQFRCRPGVLNTDGSLALDFGEFIYGTPQPFYQDRPKQANHVVKTMFKKAAEGVVLMVFCQDGSFYTATDQNYEITHWNNSGQKELVITKEWAKQTGRTSSLDYLYEEYITMDFMREKWYPFNVFQKAFQEAEPSTLFPPILDLLAFDNCRLLVIRSYDPIAGTALADYFNDQGSFLGKVTLPKTQFRMFGGLNAMLPRIVLKNGRAACLESNEDKELTLVYYEYQDVLKQ